METPPNNAEENAGNQPSLTKFSLRSLLYATTFFAVCCTAISFYLTELPTKQRVIIVLLWLFAHSPAVYIALRDIWQHRRLTKTAGPLLLKVHPPRWQFYLVVFSLLAVDLFHVFILKHLTLSYSNNVVLWILLIALWSFVLGKLLARVPNECRAICFHQRGILLATRYIRWQQAERYTWYRKQDLLLYRVPQSLKLTECSLGRIPTHLKGKVTAILDEHLSMNHEVENTDAKEL